MIEDKLLDHLADLGSMKKIKHHNMLLDFFLEYPHIQKLKPLKIIILNAPCNGFGDLVFAMKLDKYIKKWYRSCRVQIASTFIKGLRSLGYNNAIQLDYGKGSSQCRNFGGLKLKTKEKFDLILIAPLSFDFDPDLRQIRKILPYATYWNTYWFSEYNDYTNKGFSINTGIGKNRDGLFLTNTKCGALPNLKIGTKKVPFALSYIADSLPGVERCLLSFIHMICIKYKEKKFLLVAPPWVAKMRLDTSLRKIKHYRNIVMVDNNKKIRIIRGEGDGLPTFYIRCDILPVENSKMIALMKYSVRDILLTGDQSISDCLSCCSTKNIFYQIASWKADFAKELTKLLPNKYLRSVTTSCGTLKAISYKSDYHKFVRDHDFKNLGKPKLTAIMHAASACKSSQYLQALYEIIQKTRTMGSLRNKLDL